MVTVAIGMNAWNWNKPDSSYFPSGNVSADGLLTRSLKEVIF